MSTGTNQELSALIDRATAGDKAALETIVLNIQDLVFNLSLRMLGTFHDAEDATQDMARCSRSTAALQATFWV